MNRLIAASAALAASTLVAAAPAAAGDYTGPGLSADLVMVDSRVGSGRITGRYYFDRGGQRYELTGATRHRMLIFNRFAGHQILVGRNGRVQVDERRGTALAVRFGDEPCGGYTRPLFLGSESRSGRSIQVWRCERPQQVLIDGGFRPRERVTMWFDSGLKHFVRMEGDSGWRIELRNIREGRQPPSLFDAPSDSARFTASARLADIEASED